MPRLSAAVLCAALALAPTPTAAQHASGVVPPCGAPLAFQILLDRQNFSSGVIDGRLGPNVTRALAAFQASRGLPATGAPDCATWDALGGAAEALVASYTITTDDAAGPFVDRIPVDLMEQASLPALAYRSVLERLAERFHVAPALLARMNAGVPLAAGSTIAVPAVTPFNPDVKPPALHRAAQPSRAGATARIVRIEVSRSESALRAVREDGTLALFAPVTSGSEHDPLPVGTWQVTSVHWMPKFHYNPALFWDANPSHAKATIAPGPNNPVGVVWIDINVEHYGLHGTPEPSRIGHTQSHGCVRLTNWDAARLAMLARPGTPVIFK